MHSGFNHVICITLVASNPSRFSFFSYLKRLLPQKVRQRPHFQPIEPKPLHQSCRQSQPGAPIRFQGPDL